jgi:phenylalanyl-tRNA synthetase beta chain
MRVPLSWLRECVELPAAATGREVADRLIRAGLEVETVERLGWDLTGPLVVGRVLDVEELSGFKKPIRFCQVDVGEDAPHGIVCGAWNFGIGDLVVVARPGAMLPGGVQISARPTYGKVSDGMICSERELAMGDDHSGIIVLPPDAEVGSDAAELLGLRDEVLDIAVTPDRGYCFSVRGIGREVAIAYDVAFRDPAALRAAGLGDGGYPVVIEDPTGCDRFVARTVTGVDPSRPSPLWLQRRLQLAGMRPLSLAVDVTNHVMLELGQPLHGYDEALLKGPIVVRRARAGEQLETLDGATRDLDPQDLLITDDSGPIGLAGVMGGATTELSALTSVVVIEAAHFDPVSIARTSRRHKLTSEASRRFERGVDHLLPAAAAKRAADLLAELAGGTRDGAVTVVGEGAPPAPVRIAADHPGRVAGRPIDEPTVVRRLEQIGAAVAVDGGEPTGGAPTGGALTAGALIVTPPSWRPDLTDPNDLAEEVIRLEGYDSVPSTLPLAPAGRGLTPAQRLRRRVGRALAGAGYVEVLCYPFVGERDWAALGFDADDPRRFALRLANPLSDEEPELRTTLLPGLLATLRRNVGRGLPDIAIFETGAVYLPSPGAPAAPQLPVDRRPTDAEVKQVQAALPRQPVHVGVVLCGYREPQGWWGPGRPVSWADAVEAARTVGRAAGIAVDALTVGPADAVPLEVRSGVRAPWHPGRCADLIVGDRVIGHAGELHPRVVSALRLPARTCAMELDLDVLTEHAAQIVPAPRISAYPVATQDVALVVDADVPVAAVEEALRAGAGELLESIRLFDVYTGSQIGEGRRSLAFALRLRAPDRTLTVEEASAARDAAIEEAARRTGATLRGA